MLNTWRVQTTLIGVTEESRQSPWFKLTGPIPLKSICPYERYIKGYMYFTSQ